MNERVWSIGGMILTGGNRSVGRETLYSVGGRWMNGYGVLVEWYWQGKTELLGEKHYTVWVVGEWIGMEQWWNDTDRGKPKCWEINLSQYHFVHHKSHMDWPRTKAGSPRREAFGQPPDPRHGVSVSPFTFSCCTYHAVEDGTGLYCSASVRRWLRHCAEFHGFDSRRCHGNFRPYYGPEVDSSSHITEYHE